MSHYQEEKDFMKLPFAVVAVLAILTAPMVAEAQVNPTLSEFNSAVEELRTLVQAERKMILSQGLGLSGEQAAAFWPVYDRYAAEVKDIGNLRVKVITDFAASYENLDDKTANQLLADALKWQDKSVSVRKKYLGKFKKAVGPVMTARFYQLENKLDAVTNMVLAAQIPMIELPSSGLSQPK
jgi:hypothetical protein